MASLGNRPKRPIPRLYLVTPAVVDPAAVQDMLGAAVRSGDVAAVLLRLAAADERTLINRAKALAPVVQDQGAALLLDGLPDIAAHVGAEDAITFPTGYMANLQLSGNRLLFALGSWVALSTLSFHGMGASLTRAASSSTSTPRKC